MISTYKDIAKMYLSSIERWEAILTNLENFISSCSCNGDESQGVISCVFCEIANGKCSECRISSDFMYDCNTPMSDYSCIMRGLIRTEKDIQRFLNKLQYMHKYYKELSDKEV